MSNHLQPYPRPDFERPNLTWSSLNGIWDFSFDDEDVGLSNLWHRAGLPRVDKVLDAVDDGRKIEVPYVFQTPASGVNNRGAHEVIWYERKIVDIRTERELGLGYRLLLHFGAVDYEAKVWINGDYVGQHRGGHVPFVFDCSDAIENGLQDNRLTIRVRDSPYDLTQPRGKQYWKPQPESIFYTPSSGIWQTVWLESVPRTRIADSSHGTVLRSNDVDQGILHCEVGIEGRCAEQALTVKVSASISTADVGHVQMELPNEKDSVAIDLPMWLSREQHELTESDVEVEHGSRTPRWKEQSNRFLALWSPENPLLYTIRITLLTSSGEVIDEVVTDTGMRSISWNHDDNTFRLNNAPYFQALVLDQGYWPKTNMTAPSAEAVRLDIELSKAMGFNGCRKHQKVEDPLFLYWADRLGYLVWGEMANAYEFSPTYTDRFDVEWREAMLRDINHPCLVVWTPANESWGYTDLRGNKRQRDHLRSLYYATKTLDPTRPVNDNCGWEHVCTDLTTFHEYADAPQLKEICATRDGIHSDKGGRPLFLPPIANDPGSSPSTTGPVLCTEFGGVNIAPAEGSQANERDWGYTTASDPDDLLKRLHALVMAVVEGGLCCGFVYTQLTDIEQEVNGLYTFDRRPKLAVDRVKEIMEHAKERYFELQSMRARGLR